MFCFIITVYIFPGAKIGQNAMWERRVMMYYRVRIYKFGQKNEENNEG